MRVSLTMIVKDEEADLPRCLASVADCVDEIIVVDTGSTDRTKDVARRHGAAVFDFTWVDDFAAARNEALRHATGDWILWLDADDYLDDDNRRRLRALVADLRDENAAYEMDCLLLHDAEAGKETIRVSHVRLFRNDPRVRWQHRVHEQVLPSLCQLGIDVRCTDIVIRHGGYFDPEWTRRKLERNLRLLRLEDAERPGHPFVTFNLGWTLYLLGRSAEALPLLERARAWATAEQPFTRQLYLLLAQVLAQLGRIAESLAACHAGLRVLPNEPSLLLEAAIRYYELGAWDEAERGFRAVLASTDRRARRETARHNLAVLLLQRGKVAEAEEQWRTLLQERPQFNLAWSSLGYVWAQQGRWAELEEAARWLEGDPQTWADSVVLRIRALLARRDFASAKALLQSAIRHNPRSLALRIAWADVLLTEGNDGAAAEQALQDVLTLNPNYEQARQQLAALRQRPASSPSIMVSW